MLLFCATEFVDAHQVKKMGQTSNLGLYLVGFCLTLEAVATYNFKKDSFVLQTSINYWNADLNIRKELSRMTEYYSSELEKTRIEFELLAGNDTRAGVLLYDPKRQLSVVQTPDNDCKRTTLIEFNELISYKAIPDGLTDQIPDHIIGPARLLFLIAKYFDSRWVREDHFRNIPVYTHSFEYNFGAGTYNFEVYYTRQSVDDVESSMDPLPIRIIVKYRSEPGCPRYIYNFNKFEIMQTDSLIPSSAALELFSLPQNSDCSSKLTEFSEEIFINNLQDQFSFRATIDYYNKNHQPFSRRISVVYDNSLKSMRIDQRALATSISTRKIFNFYSKRLYYLYVRGQESESLNDQDHLIGQILNMKLNDNDNLDPSDCIIFKLDELKPMKINDLLLGFNRYIFMGKTVLRDIEANIYESPEVDSIPYWLENSVDYHDFNSNDRTNSRDPLTFEKTKVKITIYLRSSGNDEILQMNLKKMNGAIISIIFHDFNWYIDHESWDGDRETKLFSLEDRCLSSENKKAKMFLRLESDPQDSSQVSNYDSILTDSVHRNLAILVGLQDDLHLPVSMIHDIESKAKRIDDKLSIRVSFRLSEYTKKLSDLYFIGQGHPRTSSMSFKEYDLCATFQDCVALAALRKNNFYFTYNSKDRKCFIDIKRVEEYKNPGEIFVEHDIIDTELYKISHIIDPVEIWLSTQVMDKFLKVGWWIHLQDAQDKFKSRFVVRDVDFVESKPALKDDRDKPLMRVAGFGLIENDQNNTPINPVMGSTMTYDQCHATCLSDFNCLSFSVCHRNFQTECIISKLSFKTAHELTSGESLKLKLNNKYSLRQLNDTQVLRHPNCVIYNKNYLQDLYLRSKISVINHNFKLIYASNDDAEDCAERCFNQNMDVLQGDISGAYESIEKLRHGNTSKSGSIVIDSLLFNHRNMVSQLCGNFLYLKLKLFLALPEELKRLIREKSIKSERADDKVITGFCMMDYIRKQDSSSVAGEDRQGSTRLNLHGSTTTERTVEYAKYTFKNEFFYEQSHGKYIRELPMTRQEEIALHDMQYRSHEFNEEKLHTIETYLSRGDNHQEAVAFSGSIHDCATSCFHQLTEVYPACRSFDVVQIFRGGYTLKKCYFNSITMSQALDKNRTDLIAEPKANEMKVWHFEPKPGLIHKESILREQIAIQQLGERLATHKENNHSFLVVILIAFGAIVGALIGVLMGKNLIDHEHEVIAKRHSLTTQSLVNSMDRTIELDMSERVG